MGIGYEQRREPPPRRDDPLAERMLSRLLRFKNACRMIVKSQALADRRDPGTAYLESAHRHAEPETIEKLWPKLTLLGIHRADQDEPRGLAGGNTIALDCDPTTGGRIQKKIHNVIRQQIHLIDIQDSAVGSSKQTRS